MVFVELPAVLTCDNEQACNERMPAGLVLNVAGGFAFKPQSDIWQVMPSGNGLFVTFCPKHHRSVIQAPVAARVRSEREH